MAITTGSANQRPNTPCIRLWIDVIIQGVENSHIIGPNSIVSESSPLLFCLQEMKRKAGMTNPDDDEEDDDDLYNSDDDDDDVGSSADNLTVFCVSSVEYQKMKNILTNDGPPNVSSKYCKRANIRGGFNFAMFAIDDFSAKLKPQRSIYNTSVYS